MGDFDPPATNVVTAVPSASGLFDIRLTGRDSGGGLLVFFDTFVSVDGGVAQRVGSSGAGVKDGNSDYSASISYQGRTDRHQHTYRFFSIGRDSASNIEAAPKRIDDVSVIATFADVGLRATGIDVQQGAAERSYIRNLDILFNTDDGLSDLLASSRVAVELFGLDASDITAGTGSAVTDFGVVKDGTRLKLDFGANGLTDNVYSPDGDGFYRVLVDVDGNGSFADAVDGLFEFYRILGDANGDAVVDSADVVLINSQFGQSGANLDGDVDGSQTIDGTDVGLAQYRNGVQLSAGLKALLDD